MRVSIIRIGNGNGIRFHKNSLKKYQITDSLRLVTDGDYLTILPQDPPRQNWGEAFAEMHRNGDDNLLIY